MEMCIISNTDIDQRDLREAVVGEERKVLCAMIHSSQAVELVKNKVKNIRLEVFPERVRRRVPQCNCRASRQTGRVYCA